MEIDTKVDYKFIEHEAVWFGDQIARVEDRAVDINGRNVYLIQTTNHICRWVEEKDLGVYIG